MPQVEVERAGAVLQIAVNRPEKKNALTADIYNALSDAVDQAETDAAVRALLLHGKGEAFTAGNDLEDFMRKPWKGQAVPPAVRFIRAVAGAKKPIVAAVQGLAVGVGTTILLHCDLVYAADDARFMMPFINLGIVPEAASTVLLPLLIGPQRASELFLLGAPLAAQRAYEMGLVNAVLPHEALLSTALAAAQQIAEKPRGAVLACKQLMKRAFRAEVERAMREEVEVISERLDSPETKEALSAFLEKRKPDFSRF
ncbi:MAG TPA: enoyl-CoA hydratase [Candidatus Bathyarchaeia archaeon]|nr:enoyl-CoA hydratase [Candidatus Bathyarchaeia archaeon]